MDTPPAATTANGKGDSKTGDTEDLLTSISQQLAMLPSDDSKRNEHSKLLAILEQTSSRVPSTENERANNGTNGATTVKTPVSRIPAASRTLTNELHLEKKLASTEENKEYGQQQQRSAAKAWDEFEMSKHTGRHHQKLKQIENEHERKQQQQVMSFIPRLDRRSRSPRRNPEVMQYRSEQQQRAMDEKIRAASRKIVPAIYGTDPRKIKTYADDYERTTEAKLKRIGLWPPPGGWPEELKRDDLGKKITGTWFTGLKKKRKRWIGDDDTDNEESEEATMREEKEVWSTSSESDAENEEWNLAECSLDEPATEDVMMGDNTAESKDEVCTELEPITKSPAQEKESTLEKGKSGVGYNLEPL